MLCAALGWRRSQIERARRSATDPHPPAPGTVDALKAAYAHAPADGAPCARLPRIIYASRTHSQLGQVVAGVTHDGVARLGLAAAVSPAICHLQVVRELRRTKYRPTVAILASREQLCIHPDVSKQRGAAQNRACQALVGAQVRRRGEGGRAVAG